MEIDILISFYGICAFYRLFCFIWLSIKRSLVFPNMLNFLIDKMENVKFASRVCTFEIRRAFGLRSTKCS